MSKVAEKTNEREQTVTVTSSSHLFLCYLTDLSSLLVLMLVL